VAELTLTEQARVAQLSLDRTRRNIVARVLGSPLMRWRYGPPIADELLLIPQDLRTVDASFAAEIAQGHFGLAGRVADVKAGSPFDIVPPNRDWARELHGFSWLRHLRAAETKKSQDTAVALVMHWIRRGGCGADVAWEPTVIARRLMSWIVNAELLLDDIDEAAYDTITSSIATQLIRLSAIWRDAPDGYPRLVAMTALLYGDLCVAGHQHRLADIERLFSAEIARQVLPDGGHISRNPGVLVELLLDLLPLRQCFATRERPIPPALDGAIDRMLAMVRMMRLGDGGLGRFNGMGASQQDAIATVSAYDNGPDVPASEAKASGYVRLQQGDSIVLLDAGQPPPLAVAGTAHAGCLAFEMSSGSFLIFVNAGAPGPAADEWRAASRATAAHNTLCLDSKSSSRLVRHPLLERMVGDAPIRMPGDVSTRVSQDAGGMTVEAHHDGYASATRLHHFRMLTLAADGRRLAGRDRLAPLRGTVRLERDLPFAIHFHVHPDVGLAANADGRGPIVLSFGNGERWRFSATGAVLTIEDAIYFAGYTGPRAAHQIVLRGTTSGDSEVSWVLERV
jgi:uncharacterized heparinase superfamily protein